MSEKAVHFPPSDRIHPRYTEWPVSPLPPKELQSPLFHIPLYMGFLVNDKLADVIIPDVDVSALNNEE